jgi:small subunit ribosomal protein S8
MMVIDNISDLLTRIRNANMVKHRIVYIPSTKMSLAILKILKNEGYIEKFENFEENNKKYLIVFLKYIGKKREPVISKLKRISKPGLRIYSNSKKLPIVLNNLGIAIVSTSKGVITNLRAKELGIGGEILCYIW